MSAVPIIQAIASINDESNVSILVLIGVIYVIDLGFRMYMRYKDSDVNQSARLQEGIDKLDAHITSILSHLKTETDVSVVMLSHVLENSMASDIGRGIRSMVHSSYINKCYKLYKFYGGNGYIDIMYEQWGKIPVETPELHH